MKIVEKKCPNCKANLEFDVGERNVSCPNCRRAYAIEYDKEQIDPEVELKAKDIQLKVLKSFDRVHSMSKIIFVFAFVIILAIAALTIFMAINGFNSYQETKSSIDAAREEMRQNW